MVVCVACDPLDFVMLVGGKRWWWGLGGVTRENEKGEWWGEVGMKEEEEERVREKKG